MSGVRLVSVAADDDGLRLDRWFKRHFPALGHGSLEKLLRTGQIRLDGGRVKASARVAAGGEIRIPPTVTDKPTPVRPVRQSDRDRAFIRALVLYQDETLIAIDKPAGLAVQGGTKVGVSVDSLLDGLQFEAPERPRLVHRLDKDTSGVLVLARTRKAAASLVAAFRDGTVAKEYWALVAGVPTPERGIVDMALAKKAVDPAGRERVVGDRHDGKRARTAYAVIEQARQVVSWLSLVPETGRTHQLRVHCQALGTPILGDWKYGAQAVQSDGRPPIRRLMLHARRIRIPRAAGGPVTVTSSLDAEMRAQWSFFGFDPQFDRDIESFTADRPF